MGQRKDPFRDFYEEVGAKYPEEQVVYQGLRGKLRKAFILDRLSGWHGRFLDIGCNRGVYLRSYPGGSGIGVDLSHSVLKQAKTMNRDLSLVVADAQNMGCFKTASFDRILCSEVIEHVPVPQNVFEEIARILIPGGAALITTPNYRGEKPEWADLGVLKSYGIPGMEGEAYFHTAFRPSELVQMGQQAGLNVEEAGTIEKEVKYSAKIPAALFVVLRFLNRHSLKSARVELGLQRMFDRMSWSVYRVVKALGLNGFLLRWISEGVRSYAILSKPTR